jgi:predicted PolB exonuclease-like 3'-5' exonuclease
MQWQSDPSEVWNKKMSAIMVYDLETIPDIELGRKLLGLSEASDLEVSEALAMRAAAKTQGASTFLPHHLHQIVTISVVVATPEWLKVWSLGELYAKEPEIITRFFEGIQRYTPNLVSWNGSGFDLPVLHYRSLLHGISAARYWEMGEHDQSFKWNNYLSRYHQRHLDLMDVLANYQNRAYASLDEISLLLGFPGKLDMSGGLVFEKYQAQKLSEIRDYCEIDVLNTYLIYLRFQKIRGHLTEPMWVFEEERVKQFLTQAEKPHFSRFLEAWQRHGHE